MFAILKPVCVSYVFFHADLKYFIRVTISLIFLCDKIFKINFSEFIFFFQVTNVFEMRLRHFIIFRTWHGHENVNIIKKVFLLAQSQTVRL